MEFQATVEVGESGAGLEQEGEGVGVRRRTVAEHAAVEKQGVKRGWAGGVGPEHGVVEVSRGVVDGIE